ncbi:MAG: hypothetical protein IKO68_04285 [Oscillospiraceae bacterium]|nr:hypothetical protein [Oscillospiraceae bacterium]MBR7010908.1 hypothetical protein [Oscillospiraceae bacterium]
MKIGKILGRTALCALALSAIPYQIKRDKEAGTLEVRSLLWGLRKIPGEEKDHISFAIPAAGLDEEEVKE